MCSPRFHVAPFRGFVLLVVVATGLHRFTPVATTYRPSGTIAA